MDSLISGRPQTPTPLTKWEPVQQGLAAKLVNILRQLVGLKPTTPIQQLYILDSNKGNQHIATGFSHADLTQLKQAKPDSSEAVTKADKLLKAVGYTPTAKNALPEHLRVTTAKLLAEGKVSLEWADQYAAAVNAQDQAKINELEHVNYHDPVYGMEPTFLNDLRAIQQNNPAHLKDFDAPTSFASRIAEDAFRKDGSLFVGAMVQAKAEIISNRDNVPPIAMFKTPHTPIVLKRLNELISNKDGLCDKLMEIKGPANQTGPTAKIIRETLGLGHSEVVTDAHARQAALSGLLSELRQHSKVGSCFATAPASMILEDYPAMFLEDFAHMCAKDTLPIRSDTAIRYIPVTPKAPAPENPESAALVGPKRNRALDAWQYTLASFGNGIVNEQIRNEICSSIVGYGSDYETAVQGSPTEKLFNEIDGILKKSNLEEKEIPYARRCIFSAIEHQLRAQLYAEYDPSIVDPGGVGEQNSIDTQSSLGAYRIKQISIDNPYGPPEEITTITQIQNLLLKTVNEVLDGDWIKSDIPDDTARADIKNVVKNYVLAPNFAQDFSVSAGQHFNRNYSVGQEGLIREGGGSDIRLLESYLALAPNALHANRMTMGSNSYNGQAWEHVNLTPPQSYKYGRDFIKSMINGLKRSHVAGTDKSYLCSGAGHAFRLRPSLDKEFWESALKSEYTEPFLTEHVDNEIDVFKLKLISTSIEAQTFKNWASQTIMAAGWDPKEPSYEKILTATVRDFEKMPASGRTIEKLSSILGRHLPITEEQRSGPVFARLVQRSFMNVMNPPKVVFADSNWKGAKGNSYYALAYNPISETIEFWKTTTNDNGDMTFVEKMKDSWLQNQYQFYAPQKLERAS